MSRIRPVATAATLVAALALSLTACSSAPSAAPPEDAAAAASGPLVVTDDQGRKVTLEDGPADRAVVVGSFNVDLVLALGAKDEIVGVDQRTIDDLNFAGFDDSLSVGANGNELNYEAIIAKNPDVVFIYRNQGWEAAAQQLEPLGIPVVVLSTWVFSEWNASVELAATVLGREDEAAKVAAFSDEIATLLDRSKGGEASAYYETSDGATSGIEGGKSLAIKAANIRNIFGQSPGNTIDADPVAILNEDPDIIVVETSNAYGGTSESDFQVKADELLARAGWNDLTAVKNEDLHLYNAWAFDLAGNQITPLFYAKWAYPDLYEDIDPLDYVTKWANEFVGADDFDPADGYVYRVQP
ncbi:ABC transporter substrate-binding protein [Microbacterium sp. BWT-B31]|uniref:ABC transporter substrate-binding protein n=1 Tax=Microbacterium sp. BWT-B31 TaxID=3232072 RepID=UPI003529526C